MTVKFLTHLGFIRHCNLNWIVSICVTSLKEIQGKCGDFPCHGQLGSAT
jgi:hypothetical protein